MNQQIFKPDRPYRAYLVLAAAGLTAFIPGSLVFGFPGVMGPYWQKTFNVGRAEIGQILFYVLAAAGLHMFLIGRLQERMRPSWIAGMGAAIYGLSLMLLGRASHMDAVYLWAFLTGASSAFCYLPPLMVVQRWFPGRKGLVSGLVSMTFGLSGAVMAPVYSHLFQSFGYMTMTRLAGAIVLLAGLAAATGIRLPPAAGVPAHGSGILSVSAWQSVRTRSFWLLWFTNAFAGAAGIAMVTLAIPFGTARGLAGAEAVFLLMAFNFTNGASRLVSGFLSDKVGRKKIMNGAFFLAGCAYFLLPHLESPAVWAALAAVVGFAFGTLFAVSAPFVSDCFGMAHFGSIFGLVFTAFGFFSGALGPWLSGYLLDSSGGNFTLVFLYLGGLMFLSALLIQLATPYTECKL